MITESVPNGHRWCRVADPRWRDPLDASFAATRGGRWNPPDSFPTLYLNADVVTARINLTLFIARFPYGPEDLNDEAGPVLVHARLPRGQVVADLHSVADVASAGLPPSYPDDGRGAIVAHETCQPIGAAARAAGLRGVRCRSAQAPFGAGRELAWFPATSRSTAREVARQSFADWFWG